VPTTGRRPREQPDGRGASYFADDLGCALAEAFQDQVSPHIQVCPNYFSVAAAPIDAMRLLDLTGDGAMFIGALATLCTGDESRALTQTWARAIYEDLPSFDGIRYRAAHQGGPSVAIWQRAAALAPIGPPSGNRLLSRALRPYVEFALERQGRELVAVTAADCQRCKAAGYAGATRVPS